MKVTHILTQYMVDHANKQRLVSCEQTTDEYIVKSGGMIARIRLDTDSGLGRVLVSSADCIGIITKNNNGTYNTVTNGGAKNNISSLMETVVTTFYMWLGEED